MNITDRLAETLFQPSCGRCGARRDDHFGWWKVQMHDLNSRLLAWHWLCPACVIDFGWWMDTPPENPDTDSVSSTPDLLEGEPDAVRRPL